MDKGKRTYDGTSADFAKNCCVDATCGGYSSTSCDDDLKEYDADKATTKIGDTKPFAANCCKSKTSTCDQLNSKFASDNPKDVNGRCGAGKVFKSSAASEEIKNLVDFSN